MNGYFAPIIASYFFPLDCHFLSSLASFGVFAVAFFTPSGWTTGNRFRRKLVLWVSIMSMSGSLLHWVVA